LLWLVVEVSEELVELAEDYFEPISEKLLGGRDIDDGLAARQRWCEAIVCVSVTNFEMSCGVWLAQSCNEDQEQILEH